MSQKGICDKCEKEFSIWDAWGRGYVRTSPITDFDLCKNCSKQIQKWIQHNEIPTESYIRDEK